MDGSIAQYGFAALTEFDDQKDGKIDNNDGIFERLLIFQHFNQNGIIFTLHRAMVRDASGRLQELVEQYVVSEDRDERQSLVENILYVWTGKEEGPGLGFDKQIKVLNSFSVKGVTMHFVAMSERTPRMAARVALGF